MKSWPSRRRWATPDKIVGYYITSAFFSPTVGSNIALAMMPASCGALGTELTAILPTDGPVYAVVVPVPFFDPGKDIPARRLEGE